MAGWLLAVVIVALGLAITVLLFGVSRRRKAEIDFGIQSLATMKWRDCIAVVHEALHREGFRPEAGPASGGAAGTEFLLEHDGQKVLVGYKHGTAYRLGEANVREFSNNLQMRGARRGILITLGTVEATAWTLAESSDVRLIDGASLWLMVRPFLPPEVTAAVGRQAAQSIRRGLWTGAVASAVAAGLVMVVSSVLPGNSGQPLPAETVASAVQPVAPGPSTPRSDEEMLRRLNATAKAMADVAKLTPEALAQRRANAAKQISQITQVETAAWSAPRTLLVSLDRTDGKDKELVEEICRILTQHEEMRFTRVQLNPPADSKLAVRWRLCE